MHIRDRVKELRRVRAGDLRPHPKNWRTHPAEQQDALRGALAEIGYADALLARELADGSLQLIDGHLRAETTPDQVVPVLVLDVTEQEADKILATLDPLCGMAGVDREKLDSLLAEIDFESDALARMIAELDDDEQEHPSESPEPRLAQAWQVIVECQDEAQQETLYERLTGEGFRCRVVTM